MADKIDSQMLKGILYGCILILLSKEDMYGYMISEELNKYGFENISKGTIYPLLLSLEKKKFIVGELKLSSTGPKRKYYSLTDTGVNERDRFLREWQQLEGNLSNLVKEIHTDGN